MKITDNKKNEIINVLNGVKTKDRDYMQEYKKRLNDCDKTLNAAFNKLQDFALFIEDVEDAGNKGKFDQETAKNMAKQAMLRMQSQQRMFNREFDQFNRIN